MRQDYPAFVERGAEIIAIGPNTAAEFRDYWDRFDIPFVGLADPGHVVANAYGQEVKLLKFGRMPALVLVDKRGRVRWHHYGTSMRDIPSNAVVLEQLDRLNREGA